MDRREKVENKLEQILFKLKTAGVVKSFQLKIEWGPKERVAKLNLAELDDALNKCLRKVATKRRRAEIRNVIPELVKKKNVADTSSETSIDLINDSFGSDLAILDNLDQGESNVVDRNASEIGAAKSDLKNYLCESCGEHFREMSTWKHHLNVHKKTEETEKLPTDPLTESRSKTREKTDLKLKSGRKTHECSCCCEMFRTKSLLNRHAKNYHGSISMISKCKYCSVSCGSKMELRNHVDVNHKPQTEFLCSFSGCGKRFKSSAALSKHVSLNHFSQKKLYACNVCCKSFFDKGKLNRHFSSHEEEKFVCDSCSKAFARKDALQRHAVVAHGGNKPFYCKICQKTFSLKFNRDIHEKNVHGNGEAKVECGNCGLMCKNKTTLAIHKKLHYQKKLSCSFCKKTFNRKANYHSHVKKKHNGISVFQNLLDSVAEDRD